MTNLKLSPRMIFLTSLSILALLFLVWAMCWWIVSNTLNQNFDNWLETIRTKGSEINFSDRKTTGFPGKVVLEIKDLKWHNAFGASAEAETFQLKTFPLTSSHLKWNAPDGFSFTLSLGEKPDKSTFWAESGNGTLYLSQDENLWKTVRVNLNNIHGSYNEDPAYTATLLTLLMQKPALKAQDHSQPGLSLEWSMQNINLKTEQPTPFGKDIVSLTANMHVMGDAPNPYDKKSVAEWNANSGVLEYDDFHMEWGPLNLTAKGTIGLDDLLQPEGAFVGSIENHEEVVKTLLATNWIPPRHATMLQSALTMFSRSHKYNEDNKVDIPITIQLGGVFLGPVRIFTFPDIKWPQ